jgi:uncharacterized protein (DUF1810 family)
VGFFVLRSRRKRIAWANSWRGLWPKAFLAFLRKSIATNLCCWDYERRDSDLGLRIKATRVISSLLVLVFCFPEFFLTTNIWESWVTAFCDSSVAKTFHVWFLFPTLQTLKVRMQRKVLSFGCRSHRENHVTLGEIAFETTDTRRQIYDRSVKTFHCFHHNMDSGEQTFKVSVLLFSNEIL